MIETFLFFTNIFATAPLCIWIYLYSSKVFKRMYLNGLSKHDNDQTAAISNASFIEYISEHCGKYKLRNLSSDIIGFLSNVFSSMVQTFVTLYFITQTLSLLQAMDYKPSLSIDLWVLPFVTAINMTIRLITIISTRFITKRLPGEAYVLRKFLKEITPNSVVPIKYFIRKSLPRTSGMIGSIKFASNSGTYNV